MKKLVVVLALAVMSGCVGVTYQRAGQRITPRAGQTLVFGRVRFFHDGREFFPWSVSLAPSGVATRTERHLWLLRLGRRAVSAELHPDADGSLAIWLAGGDYALLGSPERLSAGTAPYEVVALVRVPSGPVAAYVGELTMKTESHEGFHASHGELGEGSVATLPIDIARVTLEQRLGTLPEAPVLSPWCAGEHLPGFNDPGLAKRGKELLDRACAGAVGPLSGSAQRSAQADTSDPARVAIYGVGDNVIGHLVLGSSTPGDAARVLEAHGGLGPPRVNEVTFRIGLATMRPRLLYTPPGTMHQLYFHDDTLVLVVEGVPHGLPGTRAEFMSRFPKARETHREAGWYELQTPLSECVWLITVFGATTERLDRRQIGDRSRLEARTFRPADDDDPCSSLEIAERLLLSVQRDPGVGRRHYLEPRIARSDGEPVAVFRDRYAIAGSELETRLVEQQSSRPCVDLLDDTCGADASRRWQRRQRRNDVAIGSGRRRR